MTPYETGKQARLSGQTEAANPYLTGELTKLGNPKMAEEGYDWLAGFRSLTVRTVSAKEIAEAARLDVSRFRRKSNRYYGRR